MSYNFISSFPYPKPRQIQKETLEILEREWDNYDVFVIQAPTAFGKTALARTLMNALHSVSAITPTNQLVKQFLDEFPDTPTLSRIDSYKCEEWQRPCSVTRARLMKFCKGCKCGGELAAAKYKNGPGIYNYYTYLSHRLYRNVLVVDEAHNLIPTIRERTAIRLWQHDYKYPDNMFRPEQVLNWIESLSDSKRKHKKIQALRESALYDVPKYIYQRTEEAFNGKGTVRGEPEMRDCIKLLPVDIADAPPMFWPQDVSKIILLSATVGKKDVEALGLRGRGRKRVCYIECKSPIPPGSRPIVPLDSFSVNRQFMSNPSNIKKLANEIRSISEYHTGEKGVIHVTYQLARLLEPHFNGDSRYMFHDRDRKSAVYASFRDSERDPVLFASGMYEGIDLPEDLGRWQIVAKVPWPSLASPAIKHLSELDPEWYAWETLKVFIQACGRVCRTPSDYGITYCLDSSLQRLYNQAQEHSMIPDWWNEAIIFPQKD